MNSLYRELDREKQKLLEIEKQVYSMQTNIPTEKLRISANGNKRAYYLCSPDICKERKGGKYLRKNEIHYAKKIVEGEYSKKLVANIHEELTAIQQLMAILEKDPLNEPYKNLGAYRQELMIPIVEANDVFVERWLSQNYEKKGFANDTSLIYTEKGERVRSKSEKIIADFLYKHGIPYLYEKPLDLITLNNTFITVYPDFTLLDISNRMEIYMEHFGMMDDPEYAQKSINKILSYERTGYLPGERLILSFETNYNSTDTRVLDLLLRDYYPKRRMDYGENKIFY